MPFNDSIFLTIHLMKKSLGHHHQAVSYRYKDLKPRSISEKKTTLIMSISLSRGNKIVRHHCHIMKNIQILSIHGSRISSEIDMY